MGDVAVELMETSPRRERSGSFRGGRQRFKCTERDSWCGQQAASRPGSRNGGHGVDVEDGMRLLPCDGGRVPESEVFVRVGKPGVLQGVQARG